MHTYRTPGVVYFDTSGPWSTKSVRDNRYYTVFVDSDGEKIAILHSKRKHAPIVLLTWQKAVIKLRCLKASTTHLERLSQQYLNWLS